MTLAQNPLTFRIVGEVRNAGTYVWWPSLTLAAAVQIAGGLAPHGTLRGARARRGWRNVRLSPTDPIEAYDRVYVGRRLFLIGDEAAMKGTKRRCCECSRPRDLYRPVVRHLDGVVAWCCRQCWRALGYDEFMWRQVDL